MGVTIKDIARQVGVSPSTVSRVINGSAVISKETRKRIQETMAELHYHPNSRARNFANGSTNTIALVIDAEDENAFSNTFFNRSVYAIERAAQSSGYNLLIANDVDHAGTPISALAYEKKVDGLILPTSSVRKGLLELLEKERFPYVVLGEPSTDPQKLTWVDVDNEGGSAKATLHLLDQGYGRVILATEEATTIFSQKRIQGYHGALKLRNRKGQKPVIAAKGDAYAQLKDKAVDLVRRKKADAFLCCNNVIAHHVMHVLKQEHVRIPEDVGIVTFDNYPLAEFMDPPLTVVDVDTYRLGEEAAGLLIGRLHKEKIEKRAVLLETNLIIRESSRRNREG